MFDFHELARRVDAHGFDRCEESVGELAGLARAGGVSPVLIDVLTGTGEPAVARMRALARVQGALDSRAKHVLAA